MEGGNIFTVKADSLAVVVDTYPFDKSSLDLFKERSVDEHHYFMFLHTNAQGWDWRALEKK